jgi:hypothetical protein
LERAAVALEVIDLPLVFVGGATMPLYIDAAATAALRETLDVDVMVESRSYSEFAALEGRLRAAGFRQDMLAGSPRCRWYKDDDVYDIVDVRTDFTADRWLRATGEGLERRMLPSGRSLVVLGPGRFLAAKIAALRDRGGPRWYESTDFEDIVLLLESHDDLPSWLADAHVEVANEVMAWARLASLRPTLREEVEASVTRGAGLDDRAARVVARIAWLGSSWRT